jgi:hypothetical protein
MTPAELKAWGEVVYQLAPDERPYGQRGEYPKPPYPKDADGHHLCRWCVKPLKERRRWWCGPDCVHAFMIRGDWNTIRRAIRKRDECCRLCGGQRYNITPSLPIYSDSRAEGWLDHAAFTAARGRWQRGVVHHDCPLACALSRDWAVDHIVAVKDGGTDHPDNLRLLCLRCHKEVSAGQHARWAADRRAVRDAERLKREGPAPELLDLFADA